MFGPPRLLLLPPKLIPSHSIIVDITSNTCSSVTYWKWVRKQSYDVCVQPSKWDWDSSRIWMWIKLPQSQSYMRKWSCRFPKRKKKMQGTPFKFDFPNSYHFSDHNAEIIHHFSTVQASPQSTQSTPMHPSQAISQPSTPRMAN